MQDISELEKYIRAAAAKRGIDPVTAVRVAKSEGLAPGVWQSNIVKNGVREPSYGPFQLYTGGGLGNEFIKTTGLDPKDPETAYAQIDFALDKAKSIGWSPWYGAAKVGVGDWDGIGGQTAQPADQTQETAPQQDGTVPGAVPPQAMAYNGQNPLINSAAANIKNIFSPTAYKRRSGRQTPVVGGRGTLQPTMQGDMAKQVSTTLPETPEMAQRRSAMMAQMLEGGRRSRPREFRSPWQGVAHVAEQGLEGFQNARMLSREDAANQAALQQQQAAEQAALEKQQRLAEALGGFEQNGNYSPDQLRKIMAVSPEKGLEILKAQRPAPVAPGAGQFTIEGTRYGPTGEVIAVGPKPPLVTKPGDVLRSGSDPSQVLAANDPASKLLTPEELAQKIAIADASRTSVSQTVGGDSNKLRDQLDKNQGDSWSAALDQGAKSGALLNDFVVLEELVNLEQTGPIPGRMAVMFPGFSSPAAVFNAIVKPQATKLREPGSGSTSDIEYQGMLDAFPQLVNKPEANRLILEVMRNKANINVRKAAIITDYQNEKISLKEARTQVNKLNETSPITPEMRALLNELSPSIEGKGGDLSKKYLEKTYELEK